MAKTLVHTFPFRTFQQDIDCMNRMSLPALVRAILNAACMAANDNRFGTIQLNEEGLTWVLSRINIEINSLPEPEHTFYITTWIEACNNLVSTRNFKLTDEKGMLLGQACSLWSIIDVKTRMPINLLERSELMEAVEGTATTCSRPRHIKMPEQVDTCQEHTVVYSDLDFNHHVNSTKYIEWMMNILPIAVIEKQWIKACTINYSAESYHGEKVVLTQKTEESNSKCSVKRGDRVLCTMKIDWKNEI
ncbi:MAG: thioesterase [Bacteroidales bacterium]|nr:thioesterase [Bacteroidales bacterium]